jgi:predicted ATP-grasp superfamily ATP-dependent carboligase
MRKMRPAGAVVIGGYINALGMVRALAARGIATAVVTTRSFDIAQRSRHVSAHVRVADIDAAPGALVDVLAGRIARWNGWALFPSCDAGLAALARHRERLASHYRVIAPPAEVARHLLDKRLMRQAATAVGIEVPRSYGPALRDEPALAAVRFPVLVKPVVGHLFLARFARKLFVARDAAELNRCIEAVESEGLECEVHDLVPGDDDEIFVHATYVDARGEPRGALTVRKLRQSPPRFGVARVAEIVEELPELREATLALLRRIGFRGMAAAEFKRDPRDGRFRFIEVNGRSVLYNALLRRAGLDLTGLAWADVARGEPEFARPNGWRGVWVNLHADLLYSLLDRHEPVSLPALLAPYRRPLVEAVWSAHDPAPFFAQWSRTLREGARAVRQARLSELLADRTGPPGAPA